MARNKDYSPFRTRISLVILGLALGFVARWVGGMFAETSQKPHFKPMPQDKTASTNEPEESSVDESDESE